MTSVLQPADVCWNKPFKAAMRDKWLDWLTTGKTEFTKSGNRKQASYEMVVNWVSQCWRDIPDDLIRRSFVVCGIVERNDNNSLHQRLRAILQDKGVTEEAGEHTGITDEDSDDTNED